MDIEHIIYGSKKSQNINSLSQTYRLIRNLNKLSSHYNLNNESYMNP